MPLAFKVIVVLPRHGESVAFFMTLFESCAYSLPWYFGIFWHVQGKVTDFKN